MKAKLFEICMAFAVTDSNSPSVEGVEGVERVERAPASPIGVTPPAPEGAVGIWLKGKTALANTGYKGEAMRRRSLAGGCGDVAEEKARL